MDSAEPAAEKTLVEPDVTEKPAEEPAVPAPVNTLNKSGNGSRTRTTPKVPTLSTILKSSPKKDPDSAAMKEAPVSEEAYEFTMDQLRKAWLEYAEKRKLYKAEFQLLSQEIEIRQSTVIVHLLNPVQETMLNDLKTDLIQHLRQSLKNHTILIEGELKAEDNRKVAYTNREKFDHLAEKNPILKEMKERLGLDTDF